MIAQWTAQIGHNFRKDRSGVTTRSEFTHKKVDWKLRTDQLN